MKQPEPGNWATSFDQHQIDQIVRMAKTTTPAQRVEWVEEMLILMSKTGKPYHERKRQFREIW